MKCILTLFIEGVPLAGAVQPELLPDMAKAAPSEPIPPRAWR